MKPSVEFKVCGLRSREDVVKSVASGASFLGFNFYPPSPRYLTVEAFRKIADAVPAGRSGAVLVDPEIAELEPLRAEGLDFFQIHFPPGVPLERVESWSRAVGPERLWLAPKMPPGSAFDERLLRFADTILWDAYQADAYGGTGRRSDWEGFAAAAAAHPDKRWALAGGLGPTNAVEAARSTGARLLDFNSGIEKSPGVKDPEAIERVASILRSLTVS